MYFDFSCIFRYLVAFFFDILVQLPPIISSYILDLCNFSYFNFPLFFLIPPKSSPLAEILKARTQVDGVLC